MTSANNITDDETSAGYMPVEISIPRQVRFWLFLTSDIISISCSLFVLYHLLFERVLRRTLHNHSIIVLLCIGLIYQLVDIPWILYFYHYNIPVVATPTFCRFWIFIDFGLYTMTGILVAWISIERHILIFHNQWVSTRKKRILYHYIPTIALILYCFIYYTVVIFFPSCESTFDYTLVNCGSFPCFFTIPMLATWELAVHGIVPTLIIAFFSLTLLLRVLWQKHRLHQVIQWRKHRKMTVQLLSITSLFLIFYVPSMFMVLAQLCNISLDVTVDFQLMVVFFSYYSIFLLPIVCAGTLPDLKNKIKNKFKWMQRQDRRVTPLSILMARTGVGTKLQ